MCVTIPATKTVREPKNSSDTEVGPELRGRRVNIFTRLPAALDEFPGILNKRQRESPASR